jgi:3-hydroxyacyl-CoA dehydrogenase
MGRVNDLLTIAVLGSGPQACELARARAQAGHLVRIYAPRADALAGAIERIRAAVDGLCVAGQLTGTERQRTLDGILGTTDLEEAIAGAAVVLDAREAPPTAG